MAPARRVCLALASALLASSPTSLSALKMAQAEADADLEDPAQGLFKPLSDNRPRRCRKPEEGEKVVYFVVHGESTQENDDSPLSEIGEIQAKDLKKDVKLAQALSRSLDWKAQAVIVAPWKRSMQTAMLAFGEPLNKATWEVSHDVKGLDASGGTSFTDAQATVKHFKAAPAFLSRYKDLFNSTASVETTAEQRFSRFTSGLRSRTERNIIVVCTPFEAHMAGIELAEGEVEVFALKTDLAEAQKQGSDYRQLSKPRMWIHCDTIEQADDFAATDYFIKGAFGGNLDQRDRYEAFRASHFPQA